jgi:hypothetical protein
MGLVDHYAYDYDANKPGDIIRFTGGFGYMGVNSFDANSPGLFAWERWLLGWLDDSQITCANPYRDGVVNATLTSVESTGGLKALVIPVADTRAVVVEVREASGIDAHIAKPGVLVYVVNSSLSTGHGPITVYPSADGDYYKVQSTRDVNEFVDVENFRIDVTEKTDVGTSVRVVPLNQVSLL